MRLLDFEEFCALRGRPNLAQAGGQTSKVKEALDVAKAELEAQLS